MIKYIKDFINVVGSEQYRKINEEVVEASNEYYMGNEEKEKQELCDLVQACYTRFMQMGMSKNDIDKEFNKHYEKETLRGRKVVEIPGVGYHEAVREQLLNAIRFLERDNSILTREKEVLETIIKANEEV